MTLEETIELAKRLEGSRGETIKVVNYLNATFRATVMSSIKAELMGVHPKEMERLLTTDDLFARRRISDWLDAVLNEMVTFVSEEC